MEDNAWEFKSSITKWLDYLVAWEKAWSKLEKATKAWARILWLNDFMILIWN